MCLCKYFSLDIYLSLCFVCLSTQTSIHLSIYFAVCMYARGYKRVRAGVYDARAPTAFGKHAAELYFALMPRLEKGKRALRANSPCGIFYPL